MTGIKIEYTDYFVDWQSTVLRAVHYNLNEKKLYIAFTSGNTYRYDKVPLDLFERFVTANSRGAFYNENIKGKYDISVLGPTSIMLPFKVAVAPKDDSPKANLFNLNTEPPVYAKRKHVVRFTKGTDSRVLEHTVNVESVGEAVEGIKDFARALNLELNIKEVVVKFE